MTDNMYSVLDKVNSSADVKRLSKTELPGLCADIRRFLVDNVSKTGGHFASNLGVVELTVAMHRVYDSETDRIVFDVGHQSYVHKILSGRKDRFSTLRQFGGLSGFSRPQESKSDAFISGHASTSVSAALGMARARTLSGSDYKVVAVIGDGALTGGTAFEGLSNAAASGEPLVIVLNDNNMSISPNVGGTASLLQELRTRPAYLKFKQHFRNAALKLPGFYTFSHNLKEKLKYDIIPANMFTGMGFDYIGPVDGHDVDKLENVLKWAKELNHPVIVHVLTNKGSGVEYAEREPDRFHGISAFAPDSGLTADEKPGFSKVFGNTMCRMARENNKLALITAAMTLGTGLQDFAEKYPKRFFDVGIAEEHAVVMAAGMAIQGICPVFAVYSSFLQRGFDMLIHDVSIDRLHVVFGIDRAGFVGSDGETHQGCFDLGYLSVVPGMKILCPASFAELEAMLEMAVNQFDGPVAVRYPRGGEGQYKDCNTMREAVLREGRDVTIVSHGVMINEALKAADMLAEKGIGAEVIKIGMFDGQKLEKCIESIKKTGCFVSAEDVCDEGCAGRKLEEMCFESGVEANYSLNNAGSGIVEQGSIDNLRRLYKIDAAGICLSAEKLVGEKNGQDKT